MELTLRVQEIYFLGKKLGGGHLNYQYIAAMPEIGQRRAVVEQECEDALERSGVAEENLMGEFTVSPAAKAFLHPLYFGDYESELMMEDTATHETVHWMFHRERTAENTQWLAVELKGEIAHLTLLTADTETQLRRWLQPGTGTGPEISDAEIAAQIAQVLTLKSLAPGEGTATVALYLLVNGCWYEQAEHEMNRPVPPTEFQRAVQDILQGGENGWHTMI